MRPMIDIPALLTAHKYHEVAVHTRAGDIIPVADEPAARGLGVALRREGFTAHKDAHPDGSYHVRVGRLPAREG